LLLLLLLLFSTDKMI